MRGDAKTVGGLRDHGVMPLLTEEPFDDVVALLRVVAKCYHEADRQWPTWEYVIWAADQQGLDAELTYQSFPRWQNGYTYLRNDVHGAEGPNALGSFMQLTAAGIFHAGDALCNEILAAFIGCVRAVEQAQRGLRPEPRKASMMAMGADQVLQLAVAQSGVPITADTLREALRAEPATWGGFIMRGESWSWDLRQVRLTRFRGVIDGYDYLTRLDEIVGIVPEEARRAPLPVTAIADAIDHTNAVWKNVFGDPLLTIKVAGVIAGLTQPVMSEGEFINRCSELGIVFNWFGTGRRQNKETGEEGLGTLAGLQQTLRERLGDNNPAVAAVSVLRDIGDVRTAQQHRETDAKAAAAKVRLGMSSLGNDWPAAWELVRHRLVDALRVIREEVQA